MRVLVANRQITNDTRRYNYLIEINGVKVKIPKDWKFTVRKDVDKDGVIG